LDLYNKALKSYIINFGETHPYTAEMYEIFGDYYSELKNYKKALGYYQKSLIANSNTFNSKDIIDNPNKEGVLSEIQLLRSLKKKSSALMAASNENRKKSEPQLKLSLNSLELALKVIRSMRNSFVSTESKLYITENEKEFYILAIESALRLHELNGQNKYIEKAYEFSQKSKAAVLINEINLNEAFLQIIPKHLKEKKSELQQNIQSYKKLIFDENEKREPSESKITLWQSELFKINKDYEDFLKQVKMDYPDYSKLMSKTEIYDLSKLQKELNSYEILVEYSYSLKENNDQLYTFVISHKGLNYYRTQIDEEFKQNLHYFKQTVSNTRQESMTLDEYNKLNTVSHELYKILLKPLGYDFNTKKIIIVPDEQIAYLSFDALLPSYEPESTINFAGLNYLVYDYQFTYAYSSNLLFNQQEKNKQSSFVYAFAPSYHKISTNQSRQSLGELKSSKKEINSVLHFFEGKAFIGDSAIKDNFKSLMHKSGIFHFALHAKSEQNDSKYSFLAFTSLDSINNNNLMYNYEISSSAMNASMVVLSACNTGDGEIYSGEGVMSLSRGFILAGVSSVVQTLWEVRDETSFLIMESFYKNLSEGTSKREALQLAKINYIKNASPQLVNPSYWSAYVIMGNYSPIAKSYWLIITLFILFLIFGAGITIVILKRKK
ncbi:MAG: CHAT domain-containing tetratricopeptide repeat protein, partial [Bacteroidota bacterium]